MEIQSQLSVEGVLLYIRMPIFIVNIINIVKFFFKILFNTVVKMFIKIFVMIVVRAAVKIVKIVNIV